MRFTSDMTQQPGRVAAHLDWFEVTEVRGHIANRPKGWTTSR